MTMQSKNKVNKGVNVIRVTKIPPKQISDWMFNNIYEYLIKLQLKVIFLI